MEPLEVSFSKTKPRLSQFGTRTCTLLDYHTLGLWVVDSHTLKLPLEGQIPDFLTSQVFCFGTETFILD